MAQAMSRAPAAGATHITLGVGSSSRNLRAEKVKTRLQKRSVEMMLH
jgi:hypothetical protein